MPVFSPSVDQGANPRRQSVDRSAVSGPSGDDHVRPSAAGFDVLSVHRLDARYVLSLDLCSIAATLRAVPRDPSGKTLLGRGRDEDTQGREFPDTRLGQDEETVRDDDGCGVDGEAFRMSCLRDEVVPGSTDGLSPKERLEVPHEQVGFEAARLVDVDAAAVERSQLRQVTVVCVVWESRGRDRRQGRPKVRHDGGLPRRTAARDGQKDALTRS